MNVLITGSSGFIGKHLVSRLREAEKHITVFEFGSKNTIKELNFFVKKSDYIFHIAGANRSLSSDNFYNVNRDLTRKLCLFVEETNRSIPIVVSSTIHVDHYNDYAKSKKQGENILYTLSEKTGNKLNLYRLPNVFGGGCKPNYNSAVATFAYNIANDLPIKINDSDHIITLCYIDDVVDEFVSVFTGSENRVSSKLCEVPVTYQMSVGQLAELLYSFKKNQDDQAVLQKMSPFMKKLYLTYLSYLN